MDKNIMQDLLDKTDIDEKIKEEWHKLDDRAKAGIEKYISDRVRRKALIIGAALGGIVGFVAGKVM